MYGIITLEGIDEALTQLRYKNKTALKYRLLTIIREHYDGVNNIDVVQEIDTDEIVKILWKTGNDPVVIKNRRKNLKSIKSSINTELTKLYHDGKNPEGIIIGPDNTFIMSDEARDNAIKSFKDSRGTDDLSSLEQFSNFINDIKDFLQSSPASFDLKQNVDPGTLHELKDVLQALSEKVGLYAAPVPYSPDNSTPSKGNEPVSGYTSGMGGINVIDDVENLETAEQIEAIDPEVIEVEDVIDEIDAEEIDEEPEEILDEIVDSNIEDIVEEIADAEELEAEDISDDIEEVVVDDTPDVIEEATDTALDDIDDAEIVDVVENVEDAEELDTDDLTDLEDVTDEIDEEEIDEEPEKLLDEVDDGDIEDVVEQVADVEEVEAEDFIDDIEKVEIDDDPGEIDKELKTITDENDDMELVDVVENVDDVEEIDADDLTDIEDVDDEIDAEEFDEAPEELLDEIDEGDIEDAADVEEVEADDISDDIDEVEVDDIPVEVEDEPDTSGRMLEEEVPEEFETPDSDDSKLLAENFNHSLAAMDKYYNQYIFIPGGDYIIGIGRPRWNEKPEETVQLSSFYCGKFPITNALFEIFVEKTGYVTTAEKIGHGTVYYGRRLHKIRNDSLGRLVFSGNSDLIIKEVKGACWYQPFGPGSTLHKKRNHPVVQVSLEDAMAFAAWTGKKLPTEEEWEAAARTAQGYIFPWGNEWKNDACNTEESLVGDTMPVDHYLDSSNEFGMLDLMGNVMEWTQTHSEYVSNEQNASVLYITKGGSFISANGICLPRRSKLQPESHSNILGFRCVAI